MGERPKTTTIPFGLIAGSFVTGFLKDCDSITPDLTFHLLPEENVLKLNSTAAKVCVPA